VSGRTASLDARVLEGTEGGVTLSGSATATAEGTDVTVRWTSPGAPYVSAAGTPVSRGRACTVPGAVLEGACPVTDGDLVGGRRLPDPCFGRDVGPTAPPCTPTVVVDLRGTAAADLVVVRGCAGCGVAVRAGASSFQVIGTVGQDFGQLRLPGTRLSALRLSGTSAALSEVSVWAAPAVAKPGSAPTPALAPTDDRTADRLRADDPSGAERLGLGPVLLAVGALLGAGAGVGAALGSRPRRRPA
jgi:hypothetical protein